MPNYDDLINPTLAALQTLGGSGNVSEIYNEILKILKPSDTIIDFPHSDKSSESELQYRLAWARTYLKKYGVIDNTTRSVWVVQPKYINVAEIDVHDCVTTVRNLFGNKITKANSTPDENLEDDGIDLPAEIKPWREKLHDVLIAMDPFAFERLTKRLLRECNFSEVTVTKKSGDGGIDGYGRLLINGLFSFKVAFQCKRYSGIVPAGDIRDFRGSLTTDIEKALFITTGKFSQPAKEEAATQGKLQIDLIDGNDLMNMLAELKIGLTPVIEYEVDETFFNQI